MKLESHVDAPELSQTLRSPLSGQRLSVDERTRGLKRGWNSVSRV